jgi:hypothetical protein
MLTLALISCAFSVSFYALIDAFLFGAAIPESQAPNYWIPVSTVMFLSTFAITLTPLFWKKNFLKTVREDVFGIILLLATPAILVSSGFLDLISASVIETIRGNGSLNWLNYPNWWWMDPYPVGRLPVPWSIAWLVSSISGHEHTLTVDMFVGSAIGLGLVLFAWTVYICRLKVSSGRS